MYTRRNSNNTKAIYHYQTQRECELRALAWLVIISDILLIYVEQLALCYLRVQAAATAVSCIVCTLRFTVARRCFCHSLLMCVVRAFLFCF